MIFEATFALWFKADSCKSFGSRGVAATACNSRRRLGRAAHTAAKELGCACANAFDIGADGVPDALSPPEIDMSTEYANFISGEGQF